VLCLGLGAGVIWLKHTFQTEVMFVTHQYEKTDVNLPDGSVVSLNGNSKLTYNRKHFIFF